MASYKPTAGMKTEAQKGLDWRREHGRDDEEMMTGSMTSIGVAYPRTFAPEDMAGHAASLMGTILRPKQNMKWPLEIVGGERGTRIELDLKKGDDLKGFLVQFFNADYGSISVAVELTSLRAAAFGEITLITSPEVFVTIRALKIAVFPDLCPDSAGEGIDSNSLKIVSR